MLFLLVDEDQSITSHDLLKKILREQLTHMSHFKEINSQVENLY